MTGALTLVAAAFGHQTTLYCALQCDKTATQVELKRAYRRVALLYHPDKVHSRAASSSSAAAATGPSKSAECSNDGCGGGGNASFTVSKVKSISPKERIRDATLKFQAVSAAYQVLMDPNRRAFYDATGRVRDDDGMHHNQSSPSSPSSSAGRRRGTGTADQQQQQRWDEFFHSVFNEMVSAGSKYGNAESYRGSDVEKRDVLKYYAMCKGDIDKVMECVVHGENGDRDRWVKEIIEPAIRRGEVERYNSNNDKKMGGKGTGTAAACLLVDSDDEVVQHVAKGSRKRLRRNKVSRASSAPPSRKTEVSRALVDTDDEDDDKGNTDKAARSSSRCSSRIKTQSMCRKDKMEYRVAKKRKQKAEREIEVATIIKSKEWSGEDGGAGASSGQRHQQGRGTFSDALLSSMEKRYLTGSSASTKPASSGHGRSKKRGTKKGYK